MLTAVIVAPFHFCLTLGVCFLTLKKHMFTSWSWTVLIWITVLIYRFPHLY